MRNEEWPEDQRPERRENGGYKQRRIRMHDDQWADLLWLTDVTGAPSPAHIIREAVSQRIEEVRLSPLAREARVIKRSEPDDREQHATRAGPNAPD